MDSESKKQLLSLINDDKVFIPIAEEAFNTVDTDRSGFIDKDEFKKCVFQVAKGFGLENPEESHVEEIYSKLDSDGNGSIDLDEFKKYVKEIILRLLEEM